jgi:hypothetical protein
MAVIFSDSFESGNFNKWSFVQAQSDIGPGASTNHVAPASKFGIKARSGEDVAKFHRPAGSPENAKIFKEWSSDNKRDQFGRTLDTLPNDGSPEGVYKVWYYLPEDYKHTSRQWTNLLQFKEEGTLNGKWQQNPSWWLNMSPADAHGPGGSEPILFVNYWGSPDDDYVPIIAQPTGRNQNGGAAPRSFLVYADDGKRQQIKKSGTPWRHSYRNTRALSSEYFLVLIG